MSFATPGFGPLAAIIALDRCFGCGLEVIGMQIPGSPICFECHEKAARFALEQDAKLIAHRRSDGSVGFKWIPRGTDVDGTDLVEYARR